MKYKINTNLILCYHLRHNIAKPNAKLNLGVYLTWKTSEFYKNVHYTTDLHQLRLLHFPKNFYMNKFN